VRTLVMGGTRFLGVEVVNELLRAGHDVVAFHRGSRQPEWVAPVEQVIGDRNVQQDRALLAELDIDVAVIADGPLHVPGRVTVQRADGTILETRKRSPCADAAHPRTSRSATERIATSTAATTAPPTTQRQPAHLAWVKLNYLDAKLMADFMEKSAMNKTITDRQTRRKGHAGHQQMDD
jgi:NAD(P)-dependent dehydrogenase (short-subunit alcohol dehydrogenase family)